MSWADTARSVGLLTRFLRRPLPDMVVLFVDPDAASAQALARALRRVSAVAVAPTWQAATDALSARTPHLIVIELDLPDMSGVELITTIHASPALQHTLVMVVTTRAGLQDKIAAFQAGVDDYLVKPVSSEEFVQHVERISHFRRIVHDG